MALLNDLAARIYAFNVEMGWHQDAPDLAKYLMNLHAEVSELWEAWRADKVHPAPYATEADLCDKTEKMREHGIEPLTCIEEGLADILIRTLDTAHAYGVDVDRAVRLKMAYNATRGKRWGGKLA